MRGMTANDRLGGRLPLFDPKTLNGAQQKLYDYLISSKINWARKANFQGDLPDGRLIGPFNVFLYAPEMAQAFNNWLDAETAHTSLPADIREVIILTVGSAWHADYELYAHSAIGRKAGLTESNIHSIIQGREPADLPRKAAAAYRFTNALVKERSVEERQYADAVEALGVQGIADMVNPIGLYLATSALLNAFRIPAPQSN